MEKKIVETARGTYRYIGVRLRMKRNCRPTKVKMHSTALYAVESGVMRLHTYSNRLL